MSKRSDAIEIMKANATLPMKDVVALIADRIGVTDANAKSYYKWIVAHGMAPGVVEKTARATKAPKAKAAAKPKLIKVPKPRVAGEKEAAEKAALGKTKTAEEIADIRAKNLARLKAVGRKYAKGQYAEGRTGREHTDDEARAEVTNLENELDSFKAPKFLNMSDVKALV